MLLSYINSMQDLLGESLIGILIVFGALTLLVFAFNLSAKINTGTMRKRSRKFSSDGELSPDTLDAEKTAAMFMALHLYLNDEIHDEESNIITIKRIQKRYSPWNSKIYSMNNFQ